MTIVTLDTNILCSDYWMKGTSFRLLMEGMRLLPAELVISEVVLDETLNRYREDLSDKLKEIDKANKHLGSLLFEHPSQDRVKELDSLCDNYKRYLLNQFDEKKIKIVPYPQVDHKVIVAHDLKRLKPFKRDGRGYRDYLIWESVRKTAKYGHTLIFITSNLDDFGLGPEPHSELPQSWESVQIVSSLSKFNEQYVTKHLNTRDRLKQELANSNADFFDVYKWINDELQDKIQFEDWIGPVIFGIPEGIGSFYLSRIRSIEKVDIVEVFELDDKNVIVKSEITVQLRFSVSFDWKDYESTSEVRTMLGKSEEPFSWINTDFEETVAIGVSFILDPMAKELVEADFSSIQSDLDKIDFESN